MYVYQELSPEISPIISKYFSSSRISIQYSSAGREVGVLNHEKMIIEMISSSAKVV